MKHWSNNRRAVGRRVHFSAGQGAFRPMIALVLLLASLQSLVRGDEAAEATKDLLAMSGAKGGVCALLECGDGRLLTELTRDGRFLVHGITTDSTTETATRKRLASEGLSGIGSVEVLPLDRLPYANNLVNLLVAEEALTLLRNGLTPAEILRVLCPNGVACLSVTPDKRQNLESVMTNAGIRAFRFEQRSKLWLVFKKPRPAE
ncbi:MAG: methyltransferase domain-containing protein, partial [Planctomycetota bacterium]|nr:methyltransferase domain-containing protein [Planctomycetota bacterium]